MTRILDAQDKIPQTARVSGSEFTHLTSLLNVCARAQVILRASGTPVSRSPTGGHRVMWGIGRFIEAHIRDTFIKADGEHRVYGTWSCLCGLSNYSGFLNPREPRCTSCGQQPTNYHELTLYDAAYGVSGNPDMGVLINGLMYPIEIKSMNSARWTDLERPLPDHVLQAGGYHRLYQSNGFDMGDRAIIIYCVKEFKYGSPYKEFHVPMGSSADAHVTTSLDIMWRTARDIKNGSMKSLPPRVCHDMECTRSKDCPAMATCWSMN